MRCSVENDPTLQEGIVKPSSWGDHCGEKLEQLKFKTPVCIIFYITVLWSYCPQWEPAALEAAGVTGKKGHYPYNLPDENATAFFSTDTQHIAAFKGSSEVRPFSEFLAHLEKESVDLTEVQIICHKVDPESVTEATGEIVARKYNVAVPAGETTCFAVKLATEDQGQGNRKITKADDQDLLTWCTLVSASASLETQLIPIPVNPQLQTGSSLLWTQCL